MQRHRRHRTRTSRSHVIEHPAEATGREGCHPNRLSSQSSPRFSFFRYDSHYIKVWHSIYLTGNAVLSQSVGRYFAPLQTLQAEIALKSPFLCVNRSLIRCVFLRGPAKEVSGKVWTYESGKIIAVKYWTFWLGNCCSAAIAFMIAFINYHEKFRERDLKAFGKRVTSTGKNQHAHTYIPIDATARKRKEQASYYLE